MQRLCKGEKTHLYILYLIITVSPLQSENIIRIFSTETEKFDAACDYKVKETHRGPT